MQKVLTNGNFFHPIFFKIDKVLLLNNHSVKEHIYIIELIHLLCFFMEEITNFSMKLVKHGKVVGNSQKEVFFFHCNFDQDEKFVWPIEMRDLDDLSKLKKIKDKVLPSKSSLDIGRAKELHRFLKKMIGSYLKSDGKQEVFVFDHYGWSWDESRNISFYVISEYQVISQKECQADLDKDAFEFIGEKDCRTFRCG